MNKGFDVQWRDYIRMWWSKFCPMDMEDLFSIHSIILWGAIAYESYESSLFYKNQTPPIILHNKDLFVYFYLRKINDPIENQFAFFFANTMELKFQLLNSNIDNTNKDKLFLKRLYQNSISIHQLFNHKYSLNCWDALMQEEPVKL